MHTQAHILLQTRKLFCLFGRERKMILETLKSHIISNNPKLSIQVAFTNPFMIYQKMMPSTYRKPGFTNSR